jgi:hypothetical protein
MAPRPGWNTRKRRRQGADWKAGVPRGRGKAPGSAISPKPRRGINLRDPANLLAGVTVTLSPGAAPF